MAYIQNGIGYTLKCDKCMEKHLIHLPSGKTIEAVGTIDI